MKILTFMGYDSHSRPVFTDSDYRVSIDVLPDDWEIAGLEEFFSEPIEEVE